MKGFDILADEKAVLLTTFRKDGSTVGTPMWGYVENGVYFTTTLASTGKYKRIRRDPSVRLAACSQLGKVHGPTMDGHARLLDADQTRAVWARKERRYGRFLCGLVRFFNRLRGERLENQVGIAVERTLPA